MKVITEPRRKQLRWLGAEILVVTIGILLALGLNAWWQSRLDSNRAATYLVQILADIDASITSLEGTIETNKLNRARMDSLVASFDGTRSGEEMKRLTRPTTEYATVNTGVIDALIQSGDLRLIRTDSLRTKLMAFSENADGFRALELNIGSQRGSPAVVEIRRKADRIDGPSDELRISWNDFISDPDMYEAALKLRHSQASLTNLHVWFLGELNVMKETVESHLQ